ncbi:IclR family transcriptional regulator [Oscillibacter sp. GMB15532]|uniref:IclR family transcriptional regulator n=1 Tax=Oscillibacter sp. GMB15532 TaxID=3230022 RepID=UPI0034DF3BEE
MFRITEAMAAGGRAMRLNEIAEKSGVAASTAMRILNAMIDNGYAQQDSDTQFYSLSYKFLWVGNSMRENLSLNQLLHPYLREIMKRTNMSCALGILNGSEVTYIDEVISTQQMLRVYHHLGYSYPLYLNACGKLFLSEFSKAALNKYFQRTQLIASTPKTLCTRESLEADLKSIQSRGYSMNDEEGVLGMRCLAFPLRSSGGEIFAGISVSGTVYQIPKDGLDVFISTVQGIIEKMNDDCAPVFTRMQTGELL